MHGPCFDIYIYILYIYIYVCVRERERERERLVNTTFFFPFYKGKKSTGRVDTMWLDMHPAPELPLRQMIEKDYNKQM